LFSSIYKENKETHFHIVGDGAFATDFKGLDLPITFWGNQLPDKMPDLYNCMDLIVLPSINEGLPMTCLESTACGTAFVGSRVGGIAEVVGVDNTVPLSPTFETDFANLCKERLSGKDAYSIQLPERYRVESVVAKEKEVLCRVWECAEA
jgi:glycosyltransferase involved in cell wall biosynthesis